MFIIQIMNLIVYITWYQIIWGTHYMVQQLFCNQTPYFVIHQHVHLIHIILIMIHQCRNNSLLNNTCNIYLDNDTKSTFIQIMIQHYV